MPKKARRFEMPEQAVTEQTIPMYRVGGYVRLSVDQKDRKTESIENQKSIIEAYIRSNNDNPDRRFNLKIERYYEDKGLTGTNFDRDGFEDLLSDAKSGKINCVIVKDFSRFGRDFLDGCNYIENIFPFLDVRFIAITDQYDSMSGDAASKRFEVRLKNLVNDMYARDGSKKIADVKRLSQIKGSFVGSRCPYGYKAEWLNGVRTLVPDGDAAKEVLCIFSLYNAGTSINGIIDYLYQNKVHRPKEWNETGRTYACDEEQVFRWRRGTVQDILRNIVYTGDLAQGKFETRLYDDQKDRKVVSKKDWIVVKGAHEGIVTKEAFEEASKRVDDELNRNISGAGKKTKKHRKNEIYENIFADVMYCGDCGKHLGAEYYQGRIQDVRKYRYYCRSAYSKDHRTCTAKSISEEKLLEIFQNVIRETLKSYGIRGKDLTGANDMAMEQIALHIKNEQDGLLQQKNVLDLEVQEAYFAMKRNKKTLQEYKEIMHSAEKKGSELTLKIEALDKKLMHFNRDRERQNKFLRSLLKANSSRKLDKILINELVDSVYLYEDERIVINLKFKGDDVYAAG